jgi:hypothetical protein
MLAEAEGDIGGLGCTEEIGEGAPDGGEIGDCG